MASFVGDSLAAALSGEQVVSTIVGGSSAVVPIDLAGELANSGVTPDNLGAVLSIENFSDGLKAVTDSLGDDSNMFSSIGPPEDIMGAIKLPTESLDMGDLGTDKIQGAIDAAGAPVRKIDALLNAASAQIPDFAFLRGGLPSIGAISDMLPQITGLGGFSTVVAQVNDAAAEIGGVTSVVPDPTTFLNGGSIPDVSGLTADGLKAAASTVARGATDKLVGTSIETQILKTDPTLRQEIIQDALRLEIIEDGTTLG